jgi:hypothetical protein
MMVTSYRAPLLDVRLGKFALLRRIDDSYAVLRGELWDAARRSPATRPAEGCGWSLGDHVAHLVAWEAVELARLEGRSGAAEAVGLLWQAGRRLVRREQCVEAGMERLRELHTCLMSALSDLPERALRRSWHPAYPTSLAAELVRNTQRHYEVHAAAIRKLPRLAESWDRRHG